MTAIPTSLPRLWLVLGERMGDNSQVLALGALLGEAFGWPSETRRLRFDPACRIPYPRRGATLTGIDLRASDPLTPPWPDILIGIGHRSLPAIRWVRDQARAIGQSPLLIQIGRPRIAFDLLDLIVTTPQYDLVPAPNIEYLSLPLTLSDPAALAAAGQAWQAKFSALPRPWNAILVGGPSLHLACGPAEIASLAEELKRFQAAQGGSLIVVTSPRSPQGAAELLAARLARETTTIFPFRPDGENPYRALLALADRFVVTGDSASMLSEAILTGKPVYVFDLPVIPEATSARGLAGFIVRLWNRYRRRRAEKIDDEDAMTESALDRVFAWTTRRGLLRPARDIGRLQKLVYERDWARPLAIARNGSEFTGNPEALRQLLAERQNLAARIGRLWNARRIEDKARC